MRRDAACIHQYIYRGSPTALSEDDRSTWTSTGTSYGMRRARALRRAS
jgi:hypothetical protein